MIIAGIIIAVIDLVGVISLGACENDDFRRF